MREFVRAFVLLLSIVFLVSAKSLASPGDAFCVQPQNEDWRKHSFPDHWNSNSIYSTEHKSPIHTPFYYHRLKLYYTDGSWKYSNKVSLAPAAGSEYAAGVYTIVIRSAEHKLARKIIKL